MTLILSAAVVCLSIMTVLGNPTRSEVVCSDPFITLGNGCYYFGTSGKSFYDALKDCHDKDAHLVNIGNAEENELIKNYINETAIAKGSVNDWWIGSWDSSQENDFMWVSDFTHLNFSDWCSGDPNNLNVENCIHLTSGCNYQWQDYACDCPYDLYVCEQ